MYLTSGSDNLALHKAPVTSDLADASAGGAVGNSGAIFNKSAQRLDHIGFFVKEKEDVDSWFQFLK